MCAPVQSPPLPPADAEVEVGWDLEIAAKPGSPSALSGSATTTGRVLGEDPAGDDAAGSLSASSDIDLMPPSPDEFSLPQPDTVHFSPEPAGDGLTFSPSPSAPLGGPLPVTSEVPPDMSVAHTIWSGASPCRPTDLRMQ